MPLPGADAKSFKAIVQGYGKDKTQVFYGERRIDGADPASFEFLGGEPLLIGVDGYSKDKHSVFYLGEKIPLADARSFVLEGIYGKDAKNVYFAGKPIAGAEPKSFQHLGGDYYRDAHKFYFAGKTIESADTAHARIDHEFLVNQDKVYRGTQLTPYNGNSFRVLAAQSDGNTCRNHETSVLIKDKHGMYFRDKALPYSLSPTQFPMLYVDDKNQQLYSLTRDDGLKKLSVNLRTSCAYSMRGATLVVDRGGNAAYVVRDYNAMPVDAKQLGLDIKSLRPYMQFDDDFLLLKDKQRFYRFSYQLEPGNIESPSTLIFFNPETLVIRQKDGRVIVVDRNSTMEATPFDASLYSLRGMAFVKSNAILKQQGIDAGIFMVEKALVFIDGSLKQGINPAEYKRLLPYVVQADEFEKMRQQYMNEWEEHSKFCALGGK